MARRNVDERKTFAVLLKCQLSRKVESVVVIAQHGVKWPSDREAIPQSFQIAKITEVPDLIGLREIR